MLRYLQGTKDYMLMYRRTNELEVIGYSDSDFDDCVDSRNQHLATFSCSSVELYLG